MRRPPIVRQEEGKSVFYIHQTDIIYYGADLIDYLQNEFGDYFGRAEYTISRNPRLDQEGRNMALQRMDNVLIVVDDLEAAKAFFIELGLKLEGETTVEGPEVGSLIGLKNVRATLAMMRTPEGQGIELDKFHTPNAIRFGPVDAPVNALGLRRVMFAVDDIDDVVARMLAPPHGAELIGQMRYGDSYRLAYIRGPEGIIVGLAEEMRKAPQRTGPRAARSKPFSRSKPAGRNKTTRKGGVARKKRDRK